MIECLEIEYGSPLYEQSLKLRDAVLRRPLGLKLSAKDTEQDAKEHHYCLMDDGQILACVSLRPLTSKILKLRQMAVDPDHHFRGYGSQLLKYAETSARVMRYKVIEMNARVQAVAFYERHGYQTEGAEFTEHGIPHIRMIKRY